MSKAIFNRIEFDGFELAPPQTLGPIRLLPVINRNPRDDIRLGIQGYDSIGIVNLDGPAQKPRRQYVSYIPHGMVVSWGKDGEAAVANGAELRDSSDGPQSLVNIHHRMAKRTGPNELRLLPLHLAMEGFLSLHFGGPSIAWSNYSKHAKKFGLSPRSEFVAGAHRIEGLAEAMRLFEIHQDQVGLLIFVADSLATAFIVSHPEDYRRLHTSVLQDFFGEVFVHYARYAEIGPMDIDLDSTGVDSLDALAAACDVVKAKWHGQAEWLASGLADQPLKSEAIYRLGPFALERFMTDVSNLTEAHIGETIVHRSGALQYLKTYRLSKNQIKRAHLLEQLAAHDWQIEALASAQGKESDEIIRRMHNVGFGYLLNPEVLHHATRRSS